MRTKSLFHHVRRPFGRRTVSSAAALTLVAFGALAGQLGGATASYGAAATDGGGAKTWTSTEGGDATQQAYSTNEAVALAKRFDLVLGLKTTFRADGLTPAMRAANPALHMIVYTNGTHTLPDEAVGLDESWFAHGTAGQRVKNTGFGNFVMNPRNAGWRAYVANECKDFMARMGADGCYLDDMGVGNLTTNFSTVPVDPDTGARYTEAGWMDATSSEAGAVKSALGNKLLFANGLNNGSRYFGAAKSSRMLAANAADGSEAEGFVRGQSQPITTFRKETQWKQDVDMLVDAGAHGKTVLAKTKIWISASAAAKERWHRYALATFLLGTNGSSYFAFNANGPGKPETEGPLEHLDLGHPSGSYAKVGNIYRRAWSNGVVYVNPTTASETVDLGGQYTDLDGDTVSRLTLAPNTADVVTPNGTPDTTTTSTSTSTSTTTTTTLPSTEASCLGLRATIVGTPGDDHLVGTAGADVIAGLGGNDTIDGLGGNDVICGNAGNDTINGGAGNDVVIGGVGNDIELGGAGNDDLRGWAQDDWLDGGDGVDQLTGDKGSNACVNRFLDTLSSCGTVVSP